MDVTWRILQYYDIIIINEGRQILADKDEVYYCGKCRRQQRPEEGIRCKICGKITVSWFTDRESSNDAHRKWEHINGKA